VFWIVAFGVIAGMSNDQSLWYISYYILVTNPVHMILTSIYTYSPVAHAIFLKGSLPLKTFISCVRLGGFNKVSKGMEIITPSFKVRGCPGFFDPAIKGSLFDIKL
jgi:hypothetical protein